MSAFSLTSPETLTQPVSASRIEPFLLDGYGENSTRGTATVTSFHRADRLARAGKGLALAWGAALAGAFIPVAHFLLVPGFAVVGVVIFVKRIRDREATRAVHGTCPDCGHEQDFDFSESWRPPGHLDCGNCGRLLRARPLSTGP